MDFNRTSHEHNETRSYGTSVIISFPSTVIPACQEGKALQLPHHISGYRQIDTYIHILID
jgi:hypothetical protein